MKAEKNMLLQFVSHQELCWNWQARTLIYFTVLPAYISHNQTSTKHTKWMYVPLQCGVEGRKLMQVNRIFHYWLLGLQSTSCNDDESYNLKAAGQSFVLQYTHIIQPTLPDKSTHTHKLSYTWRIFFFWIRVLVLSSYTADLCSARQVSSVLFLCNLWHLKEMSWCPVFRQLYMHKNT